MTINYGRKRHEEFALFRTLSAEQRLTILDAMTRQDLLRGRLLVEQGTSSDALFLVLDGALAVYRKDHVGLPSSAGLPASSVSKLFIVLQSRSERAPSTPSTTIAIVRLRFL